jgi:DNA helicase-2/ATP-dependent DNA helicase PcrA
MKDALLGQLTPSQKKAVFHIEGPLLVLAGPGSGKTRVITYRIAAIIDAGVHPHNICAITFTNKAAEEMRQRAAVLGASAGAHISTFHSLCVRILRQFADKIQIKANFSIYDESDQNHCMKQALKDCGLDGSNFPPARMLEAISTLKNKLIDVDEFDVKADDFFSRTLAQVYARYQAVLTERNGLDFDDLLMKTAKLLEADIDVCRRLGDRFRFLLIDEYQDTNHAQYMIAKALVSQHSNICATGDPDQSIYRWRGADIRNILAFEKDWPDATIVKLEENFRSDANILNAADRLISFNRRRKQKKLVPTKPAGRDVNVLNFEDESEESAEVAQRVKELIEVGASAGDIAVFYRVNAMSRALEEAFIRLRIPYQVVRGVEFYNRKEIRDLLAYLKVLVNPMDEVALLRIINTPARGLGKVTVDKVRAYASRRNIGLFEALEQANKLDFLAAGVKGRIAAFNEMIKRFRDNTAGEVAPLVAKVSVESGLESSLKSEGPDGLNAVENINELISAAAEYDRSAEQPSLMDYLQQISLYSDADAFDASVGRVALMTLHAAKGLEFENVFIIGVEEGLLPHERSSDDEDGLEEERRLFFVGITRAKAGLNISCARYRTVRGQLLRTVPSQFLFELGCNIGNAGGNDESDFSINKMSQSVQDDDFSPGQLVKHRIFGLGRVMKYINMGANSIVEVKFNSGQTKSLIVKYADLLRM